MLRDLTYCIAAQRLSSNNALERTAPSARLTLAVDLRTLTEQQPNVDGCRRSAFGRWPLGVSFAFEAQIVCFS